jgi:GH15 family glucan-1,4-alpha-glucosidase
MTPDPSIGDYGIIGDCRSAALVSSSGSMDWLCWPNFGSEPIFARLLDNESGGTWAIAPDSPYTSSRRYVGPTNVLETTFEVESGKVVVTDFMPVAGEHYRTHHFSPEHQIVRIARCERGTVNLAVTFTPKEGFSTGHPKILDKKHLGLRANLKCGLLTLQSSLNWTITESGGRAETLLCEGESTCLQLTFSTEGPAVLPSLESAEPSLKRTLDWWEAWSSRFTYRGLNAFAVQRSVLTLKLLQYAPTGAFVAAVTTSLPEKVGSDLNWDYRYCWLRDASFNVQALCGTGYGDEAEAFLEWMLHATRLTQPKLMVMYDLFGNLAPKEREIPHLSGYQDSRPVRTGNLAREQHQLDTYGEVICGAAQIIKRNGFADKETQQVLVKLGGFVADHWMEPDAGIWESRDEPSIHTHSKLLCWVALDALLKMNESGAIKKMPVEHFRLTKQKIRDEIELTCWRKDSVTYSSKPGECELDASLLLIALHGFHEPHSDRLRQKYRKVSEYLYAGDGLLFRNRSKAGEAGEGAFGICAFWAVEFLAMGGGTLVEARARFEKVLSYANDLGLYSEEIDPTSGIALGNFPQTFTHVGLINAALALEKRSKKCTEVQS